MTTVTTLAAAGGWFSRSCLFSFFPFLVLRKIPMMPLVLLDLDYLSFSLRICCITYPRSMHPHCWPHRCINFLPNRMLFSRARPAIRPCRGSDLWGCLPLMPKVIQTGALKCKFLCHCFSSTTLSLPLTLCGVQRRGPMKLRTPPPSLLGKPGIFKWPSDFPAEKLQRWHNSLFAAHQRKHPTD